MRSTAGGSSWSNSSNARRGSTHRHMTTLTSTYRFLPWARRGLADRIADTDTGAPLPVRAKVSVGLTVTGSTEAKYDLSVYGPGDVLGIDTTLIVRTEPRSNATDVESNYFPAIEFDAPDFPWLFTPAVSGSNDRLRPWCVLVVVDLSVVAAPRAEPGHPLPVIVVPGEVRATELPDLGDSWAWAHTQVLTASTTPSADLTTSLSSAPAMNVSRIVAPRRLEPNKRYAACLVPAFDAGVSRGLIDSAPTTGTLKPAWSDATPGDVRLPVYFHWEFSTGAAGDFESLARRLKPAPPPDSAGIEPMYVGAGGPDLPSIPPDDPSGYLDLDGPLRAPSRSNATLADVPPAIQRALTETLNAAANHAQSGASGVATALGPPLYGEWHALQHTVPADAPGWLRELNLDPRARVAAGLGAEIERRNQEDFMQWAWEQVGDVLEANKLLNQARLSMEALDRVHTRHIATLPADRAVQFSAPMHSRAPQGVGTIRTAIEQSSLPDAAGDPSLRRLVSPQNRFRKSALRRAPVPPPPTTPPSTPPGPAPRLLSQFAAGTANVDPTRFIPSGISAVTEILTAVVGMFEPEISLGFSGIPSTIFGSSFPGMQSTMQAAANAPIPQAPTAAPALAAPRFVPFALTTARDAWVARTRPRAAVPARIQTILKTGGIPLVAPAAAPAGARMATAAPSSGTTVAPTYDRILAAPELDAPVFRYLARLDASRFMPGVGDIPAESIMLLETNPRFIEALLVGLNSEMNRELLWREFPTDQRGTPFKHFWGWSDGGADIAPIHTWPATSALGANTRAGKGGQIVMLIRGRLLQRYPNTAIYAWRASDGRLVNPPAATDLKQPVFSGVLGLDIAFAGFDLTDTDLSQGDGWFFVLQEQPTEARFGFDDGDGAPQHVPASWSDATWEDTGTARGHYLRLNGNPLSGVKIGPVGFVDHAAALAYISMQKPVSVALHAHTITNATTR